MKHCKLKLTILILSITILYMSLEDTETRQKMLLLEEYIKAYDHPGVQDSLGKASKTRKARPHIDRNWGIPGYRNILLWHQHHGKADGQVKFYHQILSKECGVSNCAFSVNREKIMQADAVIFHMYDSLRDNFELPTIRSPRQLWIIMSLESIFESLGRGVTSNALGKNIFTIPFDKLNGVFNLTMNYRLTSDIVARHGKTIPLKDVESSPDVLDIRDLPSPKKKNVSDVEAPIAWFVSHCPTNNRREFYIEILQRYIGVDIYGRCGTKRCGHRQFFHESVDLWDDPCYHIVNEKYKFLVAFENAQCKDYVTEKTFNALLHSTVPIVLAGEFEMAEFVPPHSIINAGQFRNPEQLAQYLHYLLQNETAYLEYFKWRETHGVVSYFSAYDTCPLCAKVDTMIRKGEQAVVEDFEEWYMKEAGCLMPRNRMTEEDWIQQWTTPNIERDPIVDGWLKDNGYY